MSLFGLVAAAARRCRHIENTAKLLVFAAVAWKTQQNEWFLLPSHRKHSKTNGFCCRRIENIAKLMVFVAVA